METNNDSELIRYINLKLAALGQPSSNYYQKDQLRGDLLCPADTRVQAFLDSYLSDVAPGGAPRLLRPSSSTVPDSPASPHSRPAWPAR